MPTKLLSITVTPIVENNATIWTIKGYTSPYRDALKAAGAIWSDARGCWTISGVTLPAEIQNIMRGLQMKDPLTIRERGRMVKAAMEQRKAEPIEPDGTCPFMVENIYRVKPGEDWFYIARLNQQFMNAGQFPPKAIVIDMSHAKGEPGVLANKADNLAAALGYTFVRSIPLTPHIEPDGTSEWMIENQRGVGAGEDWFSLQYRFPIGSYVKHTTGRFGQVKAIGSHHIDVMDFKTGNLNAWELRGVIASSFEEWQAASEQKPDTMKLATRQTSEVTPSTERSRPIPTLPPLFTHGFQRGQSVLYSEWHQNETELIPAVVKSASDVRVQIEVDSKLWQGGAYADRGETLLRWVKPGNLRHADPSQNPSTISQDNPQNACADVKAVDTSPHPEIAPEQPIAPQIKPARKRRKFTLPLSTSVGIVKVPALQFGQLAVHGKRFGWCVSGAKSGLLILGGFDHWRVAVNCAQAFAATGIDFDQYAEHSSHPSADDKAKLLPIFKAFGQQLKTPVKVEGGEVNTADPVDAAPIPDEPDEPPEMTAVLGPKPSLGLAVYQ